MLLHIFGSHNRNNDKISAKYSTISNNIVTTTKLLRNIQQYQTIIATTIKLLRNIQQYQTIILRIALYVISSFARLQRF